MKIIYGEKLHDYAVIRSEEKEKAELRFLLDKEVHEGSLQNVKNYRDFNGNNVVFSNISMKWGMILECLDNKLQGKRLLDIGCGASNNTTESNLHYGSIFQPWLLRFLYSVKNKTNLEVMGIDIGDLSEEKFPYLSLNLLEKDMLVNNLEPNSFDIVTAFKFFNSPELEKRYSGKKRTNASSRTSKKVMKQLRPQLEAILKPNGTLLWTNTGY